MAIYDICFTHYSNVQIEAKNKREAVAKFKEMTQNWLDSQESSDSESRGSYEVSMMAKYDKNDCLQPLK